MKSLLYLCYYLLKTDYSDLAGSFSCTVRKDYGRIRLLSDMMMCSLRYGSSFVDYFNFRFYEKTESERREYATMGFMYEFHRKVNAADKICEVDSKVRFAKNFSSYCQGAHVYSKAERMTLRAFLIERRGKKVVFKDPESTAGKGVRIVEVSACEEGVRVGNDPLEQFLNKAYAATESIYVEDFIHQHPAINAISPSGVNTLRIITMLEDEETEARIIGAVFRISVDNKLDNFSAGNLAAEVDVETGILLTGGIRKRAACDVYHDKHPVTGESILGFKIPYWEQILSTVRKAANIIPQVRSVGWDIAVTPDGPVIIEGNSKWNKDTWQIPAGYGKKNMISKYI